MRAPSAELSSRPWFGRRCADSRASRSHQTDQMSLLGFAKITRLQADHQCAVDTSGTMQSNQQLLNRIELDRVSRQTGNMMCKSVAIGNVIGHMVLLGQVLNDPGGGTNGRGLAAGGHGSPLASYSISLPENPLKPQKTTGYQHVGRIDAEKRPSESWRQS